MLTTKTLTAGLLALTMGAGAAAADQSFITIGTGGVTGVYYPTGGAICRLVNKDRADHGIRCSVESTGGSVYNIRTIRQGELDFGVAQSDAMYNAVHGLAAFEADGKYEDLRSVISLHAEPNHIMVAADSGINSIADMKGKRVNIGDPGSGTRVLADVALQGNNVSHDDLGLASELKSSEHSAALCDGKIDAFFWVAGMPNGSSMEAASTCDVRLLDLASSNMEEILAENSAYAAATIPGGMYTGSPDDVVTWGPKATIVVDASTPDDVVYALVKGIFDNFEDFKRLHPAFTPLKEEEMIKDALSAPLHDGAVKYYKERGWM